MRYERSEAINENLAALVRDFLAMDLRTLSENGDFFTYDPLMAESFTRLHTLPMIEAVGLGKMDMRDVGKFLHNPSAIRSMYFFDIFMAKCAKAGKDTYLRIFNFYDDVLAAVCTEDRFAKDFKNKIHSKKEVEKLIAKCKPANREIARALGQLGNACYSYSHAAYTDMYPQLVYDNFGPYYQKDGSLFALKIFHNLKPVEIWPETASIPASSIDIGVVLEGVTLKVDSITHAIYEGNQVEGMRMYLVEADGNSIELEEIKHLTQIIEDLAMDLYARVKASDNETKKQRYCYQKCWGYKLLFDKLGLDWRPPQEVLDAMRGRQVFDKWNIPKEKEVEIIRAIFDPREEIPKGAIIS